VPPCALFLLS